MYLSPQKYKLFSNFPHSPLHNLPTTLFRPAESRILRDNPEGYHDQSRILRKNAEGYQAKSHILRKNAEGYHVRGHNQQWRVNQ